MTERGPWQQMFLVFFEEIARANGHPNPRVKAYAVMEQMGTHEIGPSTAREVVRLLKTP